MTTQPVKFLMRTSFLNMGTRSTITSYRFRGEFEVKMKPRALCMSDTYMLYHSAKPPTSNTLQSTSEVLLESAHALAAAAGWLLMMR